MPIRSFADKITRAVFEGRSPKGFDANVLKRAQVKLGVLDAAPSLQDLRNPPGNDLKPLRGVEGRWQLRVNDQYRVRFTLVQSDPLIVEDVEVGDFHDG